MKKSKKIIIIISIILGICLIFGGAFFAYRYIQNERTELEVTEQLFLGDRYLSELDYDAAIASYEGVIDIDPKNEDAYLGLADVYMEQEDYDEALEILEEGFDITGSRKIKKEMEYTLTYLEDEEDEEEYVLDPEEIDIFIRQVDNSNFPDITFYASMITKDGEYVDDIDIGDIRVQEIDDDGKVLDLAVNSIQQVEYSEKIYVNLVLDRSGSMDDYDKMNQAKIGANAFLQKVNSENGDKLEIISFDTNVYLEQAFTTEQDILTNAINNINVGGMTALFDAIYAGIYETYAEDNGTKCVIAFTDGIENSSSHSYDEVVELAQNTGIPVYIIGIGDEYEVDMLNSLAMECGGKCYSTSTVDLSTALEEIYSGIYEEAQKCYAIKYTSPNEEDKTAFRSIYLTTVEGTKYQGTNTREYVPEADISGGFSLNYLNMDYMIADSFTRVLTEADLVGKSLAELRIARNEIFARHGRKFNDSMLNKWFYSKAWYLAIPLKYSPSDFDTYAPSPLTDLELNNANFIRDYENQIIATSDIFPNASYEVLSEYDLALSKSVLKIALSQMQYYVSTDTLQENLRLVQEMIDQEDISY